MKMMVMLPSRKTAVVRAGVIVVAIAEMVAHRLDGRAHLVIPVYLPSLTS
jgi:hypothetical protein